MASDVRVAQQNTEGGWKAGVAWHKLCLLPLPASAPAVEQRWALAEVEEVEDYSWFAEVASNELRRVAARGGAGSSSSSRTEAADKKRCIVT